MIKNIINENLDQFGLPYGEGQRITPQNFVPTMPMRDPNYGIPSAARDQVAELTESQTDFIDKNKNNLNQGFKEPSYVFDAINNPNLNFFEKNSLNPFKDPQEPTTIKEFNDYLNKIGIDPQYRMPTNTSQSSLIGPAGYPMTAMAMDPNRMTDAYSGFFNQGDAISRTNVQGMDLEMDPAAQEGFLNPNIQPSQNMFQRAGNAVKGGLESLRNKAGSIADFIPFIGDKSLTGMAMQGLGKVREGIGNFFQGNPEQRARNEYNKQFSTGDIYGYGMGAARGPNKDAFGYNTVSYGGNYEQHMIDTVEKLEDLLEKTGRTGFKPGTPNFNKLRDYNISINKIQQDNIVKKEEAAAAKALAAANTGYTNRGTKIDYGDYYNSDGSANTNSSMSHSNSVGPTSSVTGGKARAAKGGLIGYQNGGLASMFVRRG